VTGLAFLHVNDVLRFCCIFAMWSALMVVVDDDVSHSDWSASAYKYYAMCHILVG